MKLIKKIINWLFSDELPKGKLAAFITKLSVIITSLSIVTGFFFMIMQIYENYRGYRTSEILIGVAPFHVDKPTDVIDEYVMNLIPCNNYLRDIRMPYRFTPYLPREMSYAGVIKSLKNEEIKMAFLSMGLYTAVEKNKLGGGDFDKDYKLIGFVRKNQLRTYYSGIVCKKDTSCPGSADSILSKYFNVPNKTDSCKFIQEKTCDFHGHKKIDTGKVCLILVNDEYSTSGHIVPENWLLDKGVNVRGDVFHHCKNRKEMLELIDKDNQHIGFMSNEDFDRLEDTSKYNFYPIYDMPIPYDAVLVNRKWWYRKGKKVQKQLLDALDSDRIGLTTLGEDNEMEKRVKYFQEYIYSGVVFLTQRSDSVKNDTIKRNTINGDTLILFPNQAMDVYDFYSLDHFCYSDTMGVSYTDTMDVQLFRYEPGRNGNRQQFVAKKTVLGRDSLYIDKDGKYRLKNVKEILKNDTLNRSIRFIPLCPEEWAKKCEKRKSAKAKPKHCKCKKPA